MNLIDKIKEHREFKKTRQWILSLDKAGLLGLMSAENTGLDKQDMDGLVQLAFESYPDGHKEAIITRIVKHLNANR